LGRELSAEKKTNASGEEGSQHGTTLMAKPPERPSLLKIGSGLRKRAPTIGGSEKKKVVAGFAGSPSFALKRRRSLPGRDGEVAGEKNFQHKGSVRGKKRKNLLERSSALRFS